MTDLLFHADSYLKEFDAIVTHAADGGVALDRTAFYAGGGGQPSDTGVLESDGREYPVTGIKRSVTAGCFTSSKARSPVRARP